MVIQSLDYENIIIVLRQKVEANIDGYIMVLGIYTVRNFENSVYMMMRNKQEREI